MLAIRLRKLGLVAVLAAFGFLSAGRAAAQFTVVNVIPNNQSGETFQNSEVSIGVNPLNPNQAVIGSFQDDLNNPFFITNNGGATWTQFQQINHVDNSITWSNSGNAYTTPLIDLGGGTTAI